MRIPQADRWTRRRFIGGLTVVGTAGLLGVSPRRVAAEPPPETTRLRLGRLPGICGAPLVVAEEFLENLPAGSTRLFYVATYEAMVNAKRVTPKLIRRMCIIDSSMHPGYT